jgi:hypothetical protein
VTPWSFLPVPFPPVRTLDREVVQFFAPIVQGGDDYIYHVRWATGYTGPCLT